MCDSGRKNRLEASPVSTRSRTPGTLMMARTAAARLPWLIMQPFGWPVVPEVYTMVASVAAVTAPRRRAISAAATPCPARASASRPPPSICHTISSFAGCAA